MPTLSLFSYISGLADACYFAVCLVCGLQLCWHIFSPKPTSNLVIARIWGIMLLVIACNMVCYVVSEFVCRGGFLYLIARAVDFSIFIFCAYIVYFLYSNNQPSKRVLFFLTMPFVIIAITYVCLPHWYNYMVSAAVLISLCIYLWFGVSLFKREKHLGDIYADPESHSIRWIWVVIALSVGWYSVRALFVYTSLALWYYVAIELYMIVVVIYTSAKVGHYGSPVPLETQLQFDAPQTPDGTKCSVSTLRQDFLRLVENERIYLNPDLTVNDVAKRLGTNARTFSSMLHNEMQTSFSQLINGYRVEYAKELLLRDKEAKVINIADQCGFNSSSVFFRNFEKIAGITPDEWRKINQNQ